MSNISAIPPAELAAIILCGGQSRRFGTDKALAPRSGRTLLQRAIECVGARAEDVILACGPERRYEEYGPTLALDPPDVSGPLAGMMAGLACTERPYVFILAVDLVEASPAALDQLLEAMVGADPPVDLVMPRSERGLEPMLFLGHRVALSAAIRKLGTTTDPAPRHLPDYLATRIIQVPDDPANALCRALANVNTGEDLKSLGG